MLPIGKGEFRNIVIALIAVLIATCCTWGTALLTAKTLMLFFVSAVLVSARRGIGTGLLATGISACVTMVMFRNTMSIELATKNVLELFVLLSIIINVIFHELHRKNAALKTSRAAVESVNQRLVDHAESLAEANATLAEQKLELTEAHERLRKLGSKLAEDVRIPLQRIYVSSENLVQCDEPSSKATTWLISERIRNDVREADVLIEDFARAS